MSLDAARTFLRDHHRAVLHTFRDDGSPQLSPVLTTVDDHGNAIVSTTAASAKARNLRRDPRASLCVMTDAFFGPWVRVDGPATVVGLPDALELLVDYYRRIAGEHDDWDEYRQAMTDEDRVLVQVEITAAAGPGTG